MHLYFSYMHNFILILNVLTNLSETRGVWFFKSAPYLRPIFLPKGSVTTSNFIRHQTVHCHIHVAHSFAIRVRPFERLEVCLGFPVFLIVQPTTRLNLKFVDSPEGQFFLKQGPTHVVRAVKFPRTIEIQNVSEHTRMAVKKELIAVWVIFRELVLILDDPVQPRIWNIPNCVAVGFVPRSPAVDSYSLIDLICFRY